MPHPLSAPTRLTLAASFAGAASMTGVMLFPTVLPVLQAEWQLSNTEAGWVNGVFYGGYVAGVPVLVTLTDRVDARRVYLGSALLAGLGALGFGLLAEGFWSAALFRVLAGVGMAGTYMPGLKALNDRLAGRDTSRAVALYTTSFAIGKALSVFLSGLLAGLVGWRLAGALLTLGPLFAFAAFAFLVPALSPPAEPPRERRRLFDFVGVLRNRAALGYVLGYAVHCWELFGYWAWVVAFLTFALAARPDAWSPLGPHDIATLVLLLGLPASLLGNEGALRWGRRRFIAVVMLASAGLGLVVGFSGGLPFALVALLCLAYGAAVMADSASLTAGVMAEAAPGQEGATLAAYSLAGFGMAFLAPLAFGAVLDLAGGGATAWGLAFGVLVLLPMTGPLWLHLFRGGRPRD